MTFKFSLKSYIPYISAIVIFLALSFAYFPDVMEGKQLGGHDNANFKGQSKEIMDYNSTHDDVALWSNNMFSGMPAFMTHVPYRGNKLGFVNRMMQIGPRPVSFLFLYLIGFFLLLLAFKVNPWLAIVGAIAFAFSSYNFVIVAAGHNAKAIAIGYMAPVIAGIIITFRGYRILGAALTAIALSLLIRANHPQITYYTLIIVILFGCSQLYFAIREKKMTNLLISVGLLVLSAGIAVSSNAGKLWSTMEYGKYTMRSESELSNNEADKTSGLTKSYATAWSYGVDETFSLLIPGFKGGSSDGSLSEKSKTYQLFARSNPAQAAEVIKHLPLYWGPQTSTSGNIYVGSIVVFLFILGMFISDRKIKWWLLASSILGIMLAWGSHFMFLTDFFMDHVPGYNKFRTVSMTLVIPAFAMPLLAIIALNQILFGEVSKEKLINALKWSVGIAGGLSLLFALFPDLAGSFISARDGSYQPQLAEALQADRRTLLRTDALRSFLFIAIAASVILLYLMKKIKVPVAIAIMAILFLADMWPVNKRYLNKGHFSPKRQAEQPFTASPADQFILNEPGSNNRVLNLTTSIFQDASTSYFHPSLGGYHGAKLRRYQDLIEHALMSDIDQLFSALQSKDYLVVDNTLAHTNVLNMLNTKYIIINPETQPIVNQYAVGNAWYVNNIRVVDNADAEMAALSEIDLGNEATMDRRFDTMLENKTFPADSSATIELASYGPNRMVYQASTSSEQLAVFSEIYYEKGWKAYIDGEAVDHQRLNYLLRGLVVPAGAHEIVFEFHPQSFFTGNSIAALSSYLIILLLLGSGFYQYRKGDEKVDALISL